MYPRGVVTIEMLLMYNTENWASLKGVLIEAASKVDPSVNQTLQYKEYV